MSSFEKNLKLILKKANSKNDNLSNYILFSIFNHSKSKENQTEFIELLPVIIKYTNRTNYHWINYLQNYCSIPLFLDTFLKYLYLFDVRENDFLFDLLISNFNNLPLEKRHFKIIAYYALKYNMTDNYASIYYLINRNNSDLALLFLKKVIKMEKSFDSVLYIFSGYDKDKLNFIYQNIDYVMRHVSKYNLFYLKNLVKNDKASCEKVIQFMNDDSRNILNHLVKKVYQKVSPYKDMIYSENDTHSVQTVLDIICLIIEDVCKNERVDIFDVKELTKGAYSSILEVGDKIIKIGWGRGTPRFPNNPYINAMLFRKQFVINKDISFFVEVSEKVDNYSFISDEEVYQLYKKVRLLGLVWIDVAARNVGRLFRDNIVHWREKLPLTDEVLGLDKYRGCDILKKGDVVILDNDLIFDEKDISLLKKGFNNSNFLDFEKRYQKEKVRKKHVKKQK